MKIAVFDFVMRRFLHPLLMPVYALALAIVYTDAYFLGSIQSMIFFLLIISLTTVLPLTIDYGLKYTNERFLQLSPRTIQFIPLLTSGILSLYLTSFLLNILIPIWFVSLILASGIVLLGTALIKIFWDISGMLMGIGGVLGSMMAICYYAKGSNPFVLFMTVFVVAGLAGSYQLKTRKHNNAQVYVGFVAGWVLSFLTTVLSITWGIKSFM